MKTNLSTKILKGSTFTLVGLMASCGDSGNQQIAKKGAEAYQWRKAKGASFESLSDSEWSAIKGVIKSVRDTQALNALGQPAHDDDDMSDGNLLPLGKLLKRLLDDARSDRTVSARQQNEVVNEKRVCMYNSTSKDLLGSIQISAQGPLDYKKISLIQKAEDLKSGDFIERASFDIDLKGKVSATNCYSQGDKIFESSSGGNFVSTAKDLALVNGLLSVSSGIHATAEAKRKDRHIIISSPTYESTKYISEVVENVTALLNIYFVADGSTTSRGYDAKEDRMTDHKIEFKSFGSKLSMNQDDMKQMPAAGNNDMLTAKENGDEVRDLNTRILSCTGSLIVDGRKISCETILNYTIENIAKDVEEEILNRNERE